MTDAIDSVKNNPPIRSAERISAIKRVGTVKREHEQTGEFDYEDKVDFAPEEHLQNAPNIIDLSLEMIRALANNELPPEAVSALQSFAPLGDLGDALDYCNMVQAKGADFITWEKSETLSRALAFAAT